MLFEDAKKPKVSGEPAIEGHFFLMNAYVPIDTSFRANYSVTARKSIEYDCLYGLGIFLKQGMRIVFIWFLSSVFLSVSECFCPDGSIEEEYMREKVIKHV